MKSRIFNLYTWTYISSYNKPLKHFLNLSNDAEKLFTNLSKRVKKHSRIVSDSFLNVFHFKVYRDNSFSTMD